MILNTKINGEYEMYICKGCGFASETDVLDSDDLCFGCANDTNETLEEKRAKAIEKMVLFQNLVCMTNLE